MRPARYKLVLALVIFFLVSFLLLQNTFAASIQRDVLQEPILDQTTNQSNITTNETQENSTSNETIVNITSNETEISELNKTKEENVTEIEEQIVNEIKIEEQNITEEPPQFFGLSRISEGSIEGYISYTPIENVDNNLFTGDVLSTLNLVNLPGRNNLNLNVNLRYYSDVDNITNSKNIETQASWTGLGWDLHYGAIYFDIGEYGDPNDNIYYLSLPGKANERLIEIDGTNFKTKNDNFLKIYTIPDGDQKNFIIKDIDGTTYYFSHKRVGVLYFISCSQVGENIICDSDYWHLPYMWDLTKIEDVYGNAIDFHYTDNVAAVTEYMPPGANPPAFVFPYTQTSYLTSITDTLGREIKFTLGDRSDYHYDFYRCSHNQDCTTNYQFTHQIKKLDRLEVYDSSNELIEKYKLDYNYVGGGEYQKLILTSIKRIDPNNEANYLPPTSFSYYAPGEPGNGALKKIDYSLGGYVEYEYGPKIYDFVNGVVCIPYCNPVSKGYRVIEKIENDGIYNTHTENYRYYYGNLDTSDRNNQYIGYAKVEVDHNGLGASSYYFYNDINKSQSCIACPVLEGNDHELDGLIHKEFHKNELSDVIKSVETKWEAYNTYGAAFHRRPLEINTTLDGVLKTIRYEYDNNLLNGLPRKIIEVGNDKTKIIYTVYAYESLEDMENKNMLSQKEFIVIGDETTYFYPGWYPSMTENAHSGTIFMWGNNFGNPDNYHKYSILQWFDINENKDINCNPKEDCSELIPTLTYESYDDYGNLLESKDANGHKTYTRYSSDYNYAYPTSGWNDAYGSEANPAWRKTYTSSGALESEFDANNKETKYIYDEFNRLKKVIKPGDSESNPTLEYTYNTASFPRSITKKVKLDNSNYMITREYYDGFGKLIQTQKENGDNDVIYVIRYNEFGQKWKEYNPFFANTNGYYDSEPLTEFKEYVYYNDSLSRIWKTLPQAGSEFIEMSYGEIGNNPTTTIKDENGNYARKTYDVFGNLLSIEQNKTSMDFTSSETTTWQCYLRGYMCYEPESYCLENDCLELDYQCDEGCVCCDCYRSYEEHHSECIDGACVVLEGFGEDQCSIDLDCADYSNKVSYEYDLLGNLIKITDAEDKITTKTYDTWNRLTSETSPDTGTTNYMYDNANNILSKTDSKNQIINYYYDEINRPVLIDYPSITDTLFYYDDNVNCLFQVNSIGRLCGAEDESGSTQLEYDARGRIIKEVKDISDKSFTTQFNYDTNNNLVSITDPTGKETSYVINNLNKVDEVFLDGQEIANYLYHPSGMIKEKISNNIYTDYTYNPRHWITSLYISKNSPYDSDSILKRTYLYDPKGNVLDISYDVSIVNPGSFSGLDGNESFAYDELDRLTESLYPTGGISYEYDKSGNILTKNDGITGNVYDYFYENNNNQLTKINKNEIPDIFLNYDENGNLEIKNDIINVYDGENRLRVTSNPETSSTYIYDYQGNRVMKIYNSGTRTVTTYYTYLGNNVIYEEIYDPCSPGDANGDNKVSISDIIYLINYLFKGGSAPIYPESGDANGDGETSVSDVVYLINYLFRGGNPPPVTCDFHPEPQAYNKISYNIETPEKKQISYVHANGNLITRSDKNSLHFYHNDYLRNARIVTNANNEIEWQYNYDAFGNYLNGDGRDNRFKFTGKQQDETNLYYFGARYYDSDIGRFITPDPKPQTNPKSLNNYGYAHNNPLKYVDPDGRDVILGYYLQKAMNKQWVSNAFNTFKTLPIYQKLASNPGIIVGVEITPIRDENGNIAKDMYAGTFIPSLEHVEQLEKTFGKGVVSKYGLDRMRVICIQGLSSPGMTKEEFAKNKKAQDISMRKTLIHEFKHAEDPDKSEYAVLIETAGVLADLQKNENDPETAHYYGLHVTEQLELAIEELGIEEDSSPEVMINGAPLYVDDPTDVGLEIPIYA